LSATLLAACATPPPPKPVAPPAPPPPAVKTLTLARYEPVAFDALPAVADADLRAAWPALLNSCLAFARNNTARRAAWQPACTEAAQVGAADAPAQRALLAHRFAAFRIVAESREDTPAEAPPMSASATGLVTGYYEPLLRGSRQRVPPFVHALHRVPDDLLAIDLADVYPELRGMRLRGRLADGPNGRRIVPYWSRAELSDPARANSLRGTELVWVDDAIEAFFLQIQGSGRVQFADGSTVRIGYADTNGHPYRSVGRFLVERGDLKFEQASMQGIQAWARANPAKLPELLNHNPSYVFFRELPLGDPGAGPVGALNVPLTAGYSVAVDPRFVPLGAPVLLQTTHPNTLQPLTRLVLAQDTGSAIRGPLRFDFFWGAGRDAGATAGRQRGESAAWVLVPRDMTPTELVLR
jgi:membrane-bound lytic murein transglycosylase A